MSRIKARAGLILLIVSITSLPRSGAGQDRTAARMTYLASTGLEEQAARLEEFLRFGLEKRAPSWSQEDRKREAFNLAFVLTMNGVSLEAALAAQDAGLDVIHAIASNSRPLVEQALLADVVVIADVISQKPSSEPEDGFELTSSAVVLDRVKGFPVEDTLLIRQRAQISERNILPEVGGTYLLLLSRGMYRFRAAVQRDGSDEPPPNVFNVYRIYRMVDGRVLWEGYTQARTEEAVDEIRRLHEVLAAFRSTP